LRRPRGGAYRRFGQFAAEPRLRRPAARRDVRDGGAAVRPADLFLLGWPPGRHDADRRPQRRDPRGDGRRDDGEDPENLVRTDDGLTEDGARAEHLTAIQTEEQLQSPSFETRRSRGAPQDEDLFHWGVRRGFDLRRRRAASKDPTEEPEATPS